MLIRAIFENIHSFKDQTEFNVLPNKSQRLSHHKISRNGIDFLRLSAIYGANGSGKSNMIKSIALLEKFVLSGKISKNTASLKFKLSDDSVNLPTSIAVEFLTESKLYYYSLTVHNNIILNEYLAESNLDKDVLIFDRSNDDKQKITFFEEYYNQDEKNRLFIDILAEKVLQKDELLLSFLFNKYPDDFDDIRSVYHWFEHKLVIITPNAVPEAIPHLFDKVDGLMEFANKLLPTLNTGISSLVLKKEKLNELLEVPDQKKLHEMIEDIKKNPDGVPVMTNKNTGEQIYLTLEKDELYSQTLTTNHTGDNGESIEFGLRLESDGSKRLIEYIPALNGIINQEKVFIIDEIERSIHPKTIKEIISKISLDSNARGQLIFSTHESSLLDQEILRPDEIWFAQKSLDGASKLYPLSDFNVHHTANIENGYLNGRFGGIPFLANLQDLNWHKYALSDEK